MVLFLEPYFEVKPWAGLELNKLYDCPKDTGEAWIVSGYRNKSSVIKNGRYKGRTLRWLYHAHPELFNDSKEKEFPLLLKLISAKDDLSIQVHPNDDYAIKRHNQLGKFECWYILPENTASDVTLGVNTKNAVELRDIINSHTLESFLVNKKIKSDDLVVIEPGRVHALHGGSFVLEAQEASDITYRLYDYNRKPLRELHIDDALNVIDYVNDKNVIYDFKDEETFNNDHFEFSKINIDSNQVLENNSYQIFYVLSGEGKVEGTKFKKGDCFIATSNITNISFCGCATIIKVTPKPVSKERSRMRKTAFITGIVGQDGYYLTKLLLSKNYEVHGMIQSQAQYKSSQITEFESNEYFFTHVGDMTDASNINRLLEVIKPDEIYHLASQSHVDLSFDIPEYTAQVNALGTLRLLDAVKNSEIRTKIFNLSTPYLFSGDVYPQNEETPFDPKSPFAISKQYAHSMVKSYRENFNLFAVNGICYNHTSKIRNDVFVSKKIINAAIAVREGKDFILELGNLNAVREWGFAKDYAEAMWLTLQQEKPEDYIISTGKAYSVRDIATMAYKKAGIDLIFEGEGINEVGKDKNGKVYIKVSPKFLRPNDAYVLVGDATKLYEKTGFKLENDIQSLIDFMMEA